MDSDQGKLFIGGISWETTEEHLRDYFQKYGDIMETVIMKDRSTGRARGFGFVSFADPAAADMALLDKHTINGRLVEAKKAVPRDEQQTMPRSSISSGGQSPGGQGRTKKIFVGGLASTVTEEEFRAYFEQFGTITDAVVMYDHTTQRPRGFGFITYDSEESVDNVLMKSFHELKDKMVEVKRAVPRDQTPPTMKSPVNTYPASAGRAYGQYPSPGMYAGRPDGRYGAMPARGAYPYPTGGYPGYAGGAYLMNGSYPGGYPGGYAGGAGYGGAGYGGGAGGYASGGSSPGYGNTPNRNAWPGAGAYGGAQGYAGGGYGTGMWGSASQNPGQAGSYGGYYGNDNGYGSSGAGAGGGGGYGARGSGYGGSPGGYGSTGAGAGSGSYASGAGNGGNYNSGGYNEGYGNSGYPDGSWGSGEGYNNNGGGAGTNTGSYDVVGSGTTESGAGGYGGGYSSATNRQSQRGNASESRFRPYPPTNDRS